MRNIALACIFLSSLMGQVWAQDFRAGTDYKVIKATATTPSSANHKIEVIEFFSYGCPWCFHLEKDLEHWLLTKPKDVTFKRVPAVFEKGWLVYAKAYYTADALGVLDKLTLPIFNAIHKQARDLKTQEKMGVFFQEYGVKKQDFDSAFSFSPRIDAQIVQGQNLLRQYQVFGVPSMVVAGKYRTDSMMSKGDNKKMLAIVDFLIAKERKAQHSST